MSNLAEEFRLAWSSVPLFRDILKKVKHQNVPLTQLEQEWKLQYPGENLAYFLQARLEQSIFDKLLLNEFCESLLEIINHGLSLNKCPLPLGYELVIVIQDYLSPDWEKLSVFNKDNKKRKASDNAGSSTSKKRKLTHAQCNSNDLKKNLKSLNYNEEQIKFILNYKRVAVEALILLHEKLSETLDHDSITSLIMGGRTALEFYLEKNVSLCNMGYTRTEIVKIGSHTGAPERYLMLEKYGEDLIRLGFIKEDITALLCSRAYKAPELLVTHFDQLIQLYDSPKNIIDMVKKEGIKYLRTILKMEPQDEIILIQKDDDSSSKIAMKDEKFLKVTYNPFSFYSSTSNNGDIDLLNSRIVII